MADTRNWVERADGVRINAGRKRAMLSVCAVGCCCGHTNRGFAPVWTELYQQEWERRKIRNDVHLQMGGCLGPCQLANVAMLLFDGHPIWFHSLNEQHLIVSMFDYIDLMIAANRYLPPPASLADVVFNGFAWDGAGSTIEARNGVNESLDQCVIQLEQRA